MLFLCGAAQFMCANGSLRGIVTFGSCTAGRDIHKLSHGAVFKHRNLLWIEWGYFGAVDPGVGRLVRPA